MPAGVNLLINVRVKIAGVAPMVIWGILLSLLAAVSTAGSHVVAKHCRQSLDLWKFLWVRTSAASVILLGMSILGKDFPNLCRAEPYSLFVIAVSGVISPLLVGMTVFWALERTPVNIRMPIFASYPFFVFLLSCMFFEENLTIFTIAGMLIILVGVIGLAVRKSGPNEGNKHRNGYFLPIVVTCGGSLLMAFNVSLWKIFSSYWGFSALNINLLQVFMASIVLSIVNMSRKPMARKPKPAVVLAAAASGFLVFGMANIFSITAMSYISSPVVYSIVCSNILFVGVFARVWFKEKWTPVQFASAIGICAGIIILTVC